MKEIDTTCLDKSNTGKPVKLNKYLFNVWCVGQHAIEVAVECSRKERFKALADELKKLRWKYLSIAGRNDLYCAKCAKGGEI